MTAFNVESYRWLQPDSGSINTLILAHISAQLANNTLPAAVIPTFQPSTSTIRTNALWFCSLVLSLSVALIGMVIKHWLRHYLSGPAPTSQESARIRQFRHDSLTTWFVPELIAWLPVLLELSLVLFFVGLLHFLWSLHRTVALVTTIAMVIPLIFLVLTSILPLLFESYPHPAPHAVILVQLLISFVSSILFVFICIASLCLRCWGVRLYKELMEYLWTFHTGFSQYGVHSERTEVAKHGPTLDQHLIVNAALMDDSFLPVVRTRIRDLSIESAFDCLYEILMRRLTWAGIIGLPAYDPVKETSMVLDMTKDVLSRARVGDASIDRRIVGILMLLRRGCDEVPHEDSSPEARLLFLELFSLLASLLSIHGNDVQFEVLIFLKFLYPLSSASADESSKSQGSILGNATDEIYQYLHRYSPTELYQVPLMEKGRKYLCSKSRRNIRHLQLRH